MIAILKFTTFVPKIYRIGDLRFIATSYIKSPKAGLSRYRGTLRVLSIELVDKCRYVADSHELT